MERHLRRLAHGAHEEQQADDRQRSRSVIDAAEYDERVGLPRRHDLGVGEDRAEVDRVEEEVDAQYPEDEAEIADAVDDEGLDRGGVGGGPLIPEADQQV